jgi:hypothetical protein
MFGSKDCGCGCRGRPQSKGHYRQNTDLNKKTVRFLKSVKFNKTKKK